MYRAVYQNPYDVYRSQVIHKNNLSKAKHVIDIQEPQEQPHLMSNAKKHEMEEDRFAEIERENAILLAKMSRIMRDGAKTDQIGGAPPLRPKEPPVKLRPNPRRKQELARITAENQMILKRIQLKDPHYNHLEWAQSRKENKKWMRQQCQLPPPGKKGKGISSKFARQIRAQVGAQTARDKALKKREKERERGQQSGSKTHREYGSAASSPVRTAVPAEPEKRVFHALEMIRADDMRLLLGMKRPPEIVKKVFGSLMIIVSPFETTESDISWEAVHEWVRQLQGVDAFLDNLRHFEATVVAPSIVQNTLDYMTNAELFPNTVKKFSGALATLCTWIWSVCESSQPVLTQSYRQQAQGYQMGGHTEAEDFEEAKANEPEVGSPSGGEGPSS